MLHTHPKHISITHPSVIAHDPHKQTFSPPPKVFLVIHANLAWQTRSSTTNLNTQPTTSKHPNRANTIVVASEPTANTTHTQSATTCTRDQRSPYGWRAFTCRCPVVNRITPSGSFRWLVMPHSVMLVKPVYVDSLPLSLVWRDCVTYSWLISF